MSRQRSPRHTEKLPPPSGNEVDAFLEALEHPLRDDIARVRRWILEATPGVLESVKWSAPSFRVGAEYFATFHLRSRTDVQLIFHTGAKKRPEPRAVVLSANAAQLVEWLDPDRALVTLPTTRLLRFRSNLVTLVREWVQQLAGHAPVTGAPSNKA